MRWLYISACLLLLAGWVLAKKEDEPLDALKARAESARLPEQAHLFAIMAGREVSEADRYYTEGDIANAKQAVDEVVRYAGRATEAAAKSGKHLKDTEISLRQTARRLEDVRRTVNFEDRADLEAAVKQVEKFRQQLLERMFGAPSQGIRK